MCNCDNNALLTDEQKYAINAVDPCSFISIEVLEMYRRPMECYLQYGLQNSIGYTQEQIEDFVAYLNQLIAIKQLDPNACGDFEQLPAVRAALNVILNKGICL
jgi:hypothetical protein